MKTITDIQESHAVIDSSAERTQPSRSDSTVSPARGAAPLLFDHARHTPTAARRAKVIAVTSGKGGVGKSNLAANLGIILSNAGHRVVVVDADLGLGNLDVLTGISPPATLADVLRRCRSIEETIVRLPCGLQVVPGGSGTPMQELMQGPGRLDLLEGLMRLRRRNDVLIMDCSAGIGPDVIEFCALAEQVLVVTTPEPTAFTDAYGTIKTLVLKGCQGRISVLVNMAADRQEAKATYSRIAAVAKQFLGRTIFDAGHVPTDPKVPVSVRRRSPFVIGYPECPASRHVAALATRIQPKTDRKKSPKPSWIRRLLGFTS